MHCTALIGIPSMFTVGGSGGSRPNDIVSCFVLSPFSWNFFPFEQWFITSTASCGLLCVDPLSMVSDTVVSSTYFHMSKILGTDKFLIFKRKSHGLLGILICLSLPIKTLWSMKSKAFR